MWPSPADCDLTQTQVTDRTKGLHAQEGECAQVKKCILTCVTYSGKRHLGSGTFQSLLAPVVDGLDGQGEGGSRTQTLQPELTLGLEKETSTLEYRIVHACKRTHKDTHISIRLIWWISGSPHMDYGNLEMHN